LAFEGFIFIAIKNKDKSMNSDPLEKLIPSTSECLMNSRQSLDAWISHSLLQLLNVSERDVGFFCQPFLSQFRALAKSIQVFAESAQDFGFHPSNIPVFQDFGCVPTVRKRLKETERQLV
jgi:hypothetical protein